MGADVASSSHRRRLFLDSPANTGKRQSVGEHEVLDPKDFLDVRAAVDSRTAGRLHNAQIREFRLPRSKDVGLNAGDFAHLGGLEQRSVRNLDIGHKESCLPQVAGSISGPFPPADLKSDGGPEEPEFLAKPILEITFV